VGDECSTAVRHQIGSHAASAITHQQSTDMGGVAARHVY
jgi:hypothetical protein